MLFLFLLANAVYAQCDPPIYFPVKNYTFSVSPYNSSTFHKRGIDVHIGSNSDRLIVTPSFWYNSTLIYDQPPSSEYYAWQYQGYYNSSYSRTQRSFFLTEAFTVSQWNGSSHVIGGDETLFNQGFMLNYPDYYATDNFFFPDVTGGQIYGFPFVVLKQVYYNSILGLGKNSQLIPTLTSNSNSFGYYSGSTNPDKYRDGSLTIGGVDSALYNPSEMRNETIDSSEQTCLFSVLVENIQITTSSGESRSIFPRAQGLIRACVVADWNTFDITPDLMTEFLSIVGTTALNNVTDTLGNLYHYWNNRDFWTGDVVVTLSDGFNFTIPNGDILVDSSSDAHWSRAQPVPPPSPYYLGFEQQDEMVIGGAALAQLYMYVNYDQDLWGIAPVPKDFTVRSLASVNQEGAICSGLTNGGSTGNTTVDTDDATASLGATSANGSSNAGAIAGGVVGGISAIVLIALIAFFLLRRRKRANTSASNGNLEANTYEPAAKEKHPVEIAHDEKDEKVSSPLSHNEEPVPVYEARANETGTVGELESTPRHELR